MLIFIMISVCKNHLHLCVNVHLGHKQLCIRKPFDPAAEAHTNNVMVILALAWLSQLH